MAGHFLPNLVKSLVGVKGSDSGSSETALGYRSELLGLESLWELGLLISPKVWRHLWGFLEIPFKMAPYISRNPQSSPGCVNGQYRKKKLWSSEIFFTRWPKTMKPIVWWRPNSTRSSHHKNGTQGGRHSAVVAFALLTQHPQVWLLAFPRIFFRIIHWCCWDWSTAFLRVWKSLNTLIEPFCTC